MPFYTSKLVNVDMDKIKCSIGKLCLLFFSTQVLGKKNKKPQLMLYYYFLPFDLYNVLTS